MVDPPPSHAPIGEEVRDLAARLVTLAERLQQQSEELMWRQRELDQTQEIA